MAEAKALVDEAISLDTRKNEIMAKAEAIDPEAGRAADAPSVFADVQAVLGEMTETQEAIAALYGEAATLDVGEKLTQYAAQQKEIAELWVQAYAIESDLVAHYAVAADPQRSGVSRADQEKLDQELADLDEASGEAFMRVWERAEASQQYFRDNALPEKYFVDNGGGEFGGTTPDQLEQTDEAMRLLDQAGAAERDSQTLDEEMAALWAQVMAIDPGARNAADALPLLRNLEAGLGELKGNAEAALPFYERAAALKVTEELQEMMGYGTYVRLEKQAAELWIQAYALWGELVAKLQVAYGHGSELSQLDREKLDEESAVLHEQLQGLYAKLGKLFARMDYRGRASAQHFIRGFEYEYE